MKYTIHGFNQQIALELGISNDELALLRWFIDFKDSGTMKKKYDTDKQKMFYWIVYTKIIEDLPILTLGSETLEAKKKKLQRLINGNVSRVIEKKIERDKNGTYLYIAINEDEYIKLVASNLKEQDKTEMSEGYGQKCPVGVGQNSPNKDYSINNDSSINNTNIYIPYQEIIDYLNLKANTKYKSTGKKTKELIKARINEKFTLEDFKTVINKKCNEWLNTSFENYLRPETLFSNKFEGYLNQKEVKKQYGNTKQNNKPTTTKTITGEGEELAKRAIEKYGDKLQDFECEY